MGTISTRSMGREVHDDRGRAALPRPRRLPTGRAMVGALMVVGAASGVWLLGSRSSEDPTTRYLVTTRAVPAGAVVEPADLGAAAMDLGPIGESAMVDPATAVGRRVLRPLAAGELVQQSALAPEEVDGAVVTGRELSLALPLARALGGRLRPGQSVTVAASGDLEGSTEVIAPDAVVVATDGDDDGGIGTASEIGVTLAVADEVTALSVVDAHQRGAITLLAPSRMGEGGGARAR